MAGDVDSDLIAKYTVLAGCNCLLRYIENISGRLFQKGAVRLDFASGYTGKMQIDRKTARSLELITNIKSGKQADSLFGVINFTNTTVGARLLRSSLLKPCLCIETIQVRSSALQIMLLHGEVYHRIVELLKTLPDIDKVMTLLYFALSLNADLTN